MREYKTEAVIIRVRDYGEADRIVTLFSAEHGKIQAIAKGCRKPKSKNRGIIQLFTYAEFSIYRGRSLDTIIQCEGKEFFSALREDLDRMAYGTYLVELLDSFTVPGESQQDLFFLLLVCLHLLAVNEPVLVMRAFEIRLMNLLGYGLHLENCVHCGQSLDGSRAVFSSQMGGALCGSCLGHDAEAVSCSRGTLNMLHQLLKWDAKKLQVLKITGDVKREISTIMNMYIEQRLEKRIKSADFIRSLESMQNIG